MAELLGSFLARRLGDEIALVRDLIAVLKREQEALNAGDADGIAAAGEAKAALLRQLGRLSTERNLALAREGYAKDRAGLDAFMGRHADSQGLAQVRDRLMTIAAEADELNRINGKLIRLRLAHNQKSLAFLLGAGEGSSTYGPDGRSSLGGNPVGRRLTAA